MSRKKKLKKLPMVKIERKDIDQYVPTLERKAWAFAPSDAEVWWSARAIWKGWGSDYFDCLWDRQDNQGLKENREFLDWLNETGIRGLANAFCELGLRHSSNEYVLIEDGKYAMLGSPNASHGYAYICAWIKPEGQELCA